MARTWLVIACFAGGCIDHHCDESSVGAPPSLAGRVNVIAPNGAAQIPPVTAKVSGTRVTDAYWEEGTSGEDSGACAYVTEPLEGSATITAQGAASTPLAYSDGEFSGSTPYARTYELALHESSGEEHVSLVTMPESFSISYAVVPGTGPAHELSKISGATIPYHNVFSVEVPVTGLAGAGGLAITVDITHPSRGDLALDLSKDNRPIKTLVEYVGGTTDNIHETYTLTSAELGPNVNGVYQLYVWDNAQADVGTLDKVTLSFAPPDDLLIESSRPLAAGEYATVELFNCKSRAGSSPNNPGGSSAWRVPSYALDPTSNYRITVTRQSMFEPFGWTSFGVIDDYVVPSGVPCD
jgi:hypothetical protein